MCASTLWIVFLLIFSFCDWAPCIKGNKDQPINQKYHTTPHTTPHNPRYPWISAEILHVRKSTSVIYKVHTKPSRLTTFATFSAFSLLERHSRLSFLYFEYTKCVYTCVDVCIYSHCIRPCLFPTMFNARLIKLKNALRRRCLLMESDMCLHETNWYKTCLDIHGFNDAGHDWPHPAIQWNVLSVKHWTGHSHFLPYIIVSLKWISRQWAYHTKGRSSIDIRCYYIFTNTQAVPNMFTQIQITLFKVESLSVFVLGISSAPINECV